jgi:hypothetical protein
VIQSSTARMTSAPTHVRLIPMAIPFLFGHTRECFLVVYSLSPRRDQYSAMSGRLA